MHENIMNIPAVTARCYDTATFMPCTPGWRAIAALRHLRYTNDMTETDRGHRLQRGVCIVVLTAFLPWYVWALLAYPAPLVWLYASASAILLTSVASVWPRSVVFWLPATVLLFNTVHQWLPQPVVKLAYLGPAAVCCATALRMLRRGQWYQHSWLSFAWRLFFICLAVAGVCGVLSHVVLTQPAALDELWQMLRVAPLLDDRNRYVPLRFLWVWALALATCGCLAARLPRLRDIRRLAWSAQWCSVLMALFGIYSYVTRRCMVGQYQFERRINATCSSPAVLADTTTILVLVNLLLLRTCRTRRAQLALALILALQLVTIVLSGCRINLALLAGAGVLWLLWWIRHLAQRRWRYTVALVCLIVLACCGGIVAARLLAPASVKTMVMCLPGIARVQDVVRRSARQDLRATLRSVFAGRQDHWTAAWGAVCSQPLWGIGCGLFEQRYRAFCSATDLFQIARVHNVYLRVLVEAGVMTALAGILAVLLTGLAWWRAVRGDAAAPPQAAGYAAGLLVVLAAAAITGLFSDVWYENPESIMALSILCACAAASVRHVATVRAYALRAMVPAGEAEPDELVGVHGNLQALVMLLSWGHVTHISWWKAGAVMAIGVAAVFGLRAAQQTAQQQFLAGHTHFGIDAGASYAGQDATWYTVRRNAAQVVFVAQPILCLQWCALNERAAGAAQNLTIFINHTRIAHTRLNSMQGHTLYCDVSALQGTPVLITYRAQRDFQPWQEGWFVDARASAALVRAPQWLNDYPTNHLARARGAWNITWSAQRAWYTARGFSNATFVIGSAGLQ